MSLTRGATNSPEVPRCSWDSEESVLTVVFASGNTYRFLGVPKRFYKDLVDAKDPKRYVRNHLMARFDYHRVAT